MLFWDTESGIRKKVEKAMGTLQLSMDSLYNIDVPSEVYCTFADLKCSFKCVIKVSNVVVHLGDAPEWRD